MDITISTNITFLGCSNGTIFDFHNNNIGMMNLKYASNKINTFTMKNIIIQNFYNKDDAIGLSAFYFNSNNYNFYFIGKNCTFQNNNSKLFYFQVSTNYQTPNGPQVIFDDCKF